MTTDELTVEWAYRFKERLGILTDGRRDPTPEEKQMARDEADKVIEELSDRLLI